MTDPPTTVEDLDVSKEDDTVKKEDALFQLVSLDHWWRLEGTTPLPLVDVRSSDEFETRRFEGNKDNGIIVCHLPLESLLSGERSAELPPRTVSFGILVSRAQKQVAVDFFGATQSKATAASRRPWLVRQVLLDEDPLWITASQLGICSSGTQQALTIHNKTTPQKFVPLPRLWKPDPLVEGPLLELLISMVVPKKNHPDDTSNDNMESEIWDLGCGAGRDVCYLAEEIKARVSSSSETNKNHGDSSTGSRAGGVPVPVPVVVVVGMDNHKGSARRALPLWKHRRVSDWTEARLVKLNQIPEFHNRLLDSSQETTKKVICLYAIRFLNRKLLQYITSPQCPLPPGTIFATSHFCKPNKGSSWNFDHPKEKHVLERNELSELFQSWHVIKDDLCLDSDHGRTLVQFIAIR